MNGYAKRPLRDHVPEGLAIIFEAPQRWGKTLGGVMWGLDAHQRGRTVFSNIQLGFPHEPLQFDEIQLEDGTSRFWGGHIFIDEFNFYFGGRQAMSKRNKKFAPFLLQQKKQGCNLTGTTHDLMSLDPILRHNFDYLINPEVYPAYPEAPQIIKMRITNGPLQSSFDKTIRLDCRPYLGLYDSFAVYDPFKQPEKPQRHKGVKR